MAVDPLAELKALREHVDSLNKELEAKGFSRASDTKLRLGQADKLIAAGQNGQTAAWRSDAIAMAETLRHEAGQAGRAA